MNKALQPNGLASQPVVSNELDFNQLLLALKQFSENTAQLNQNISKINQTFDQLLASLQEGGCDEE